MKKITVLLDHKKVSQPMSMHRIASLGSLFLIFFLLPGFQTLSADEAIPARAAPSKIKNLSGLSLSSGDLKPGFSPANTTYISKVPYATDELKVTATAADKEASLKVMGKIVASGIASQKIPLKIGDNSISVQVTAKNGATRTYTVKVVRTPPSRLETLSSLSIGAPLDPEFSPVVGIYDSKVPYGTTSIVVTPRASINIATIQVEGDGVPFGGSSAPIQLGVGLNVIHINVTAESGDSRVYIIRVTRAAPSDVSTLSNLYLSSSSLKPEFSSNKTSYSSNVPFTTASLNVTPTATSKRATLEVNGSVVESGTKSQDIGLSVGSNTISVVVTAENGNTRTIYSVNVIRATPSNDSTLSGLVLGGIKLSPNFLRLTMNYTSKVVYGTSKARVHPTANHETAKIKVNGIAVESGDSTDFIQLQVGINLITIIVTAQDLSTRTYTVTITRAVAIGTLEDLYMTDGDLSPDFSPDITSYTADVSDSSEPVEISANATDPAAVVKVNGVILPADEYSDPITLNVGTLNAGLTTITIEVTAQDGTTKSYKIIVTRHPDLEQFYKDASVGWWKVEHYNLGVLDSTSKLELFANGTGKYGPYTIRWWLVKYDYDDYRIYETGFWHPAYDNLKRTPLSYPEMTYSVGDDAIIYTKE